MTKTYNGQTLGKLVMATCREMTTGSAYDTSNDNSLGFRTRHRFLTSLSKSIAEACAPETKTCECGAVFPSEWEIGEDETGAVLCPKCAIQCAVEYAQVEIGKKLLGHSERLIKQRNEAIAALRIAVELIPKQSPLVPWDKIRKPLHDIPEEMPLLEP